MGGECIASLIKAMESSSWDLMLRNSVEAIARTVKAGNASAIEKVRALIGALVAAFIRALEHEYPAVHASTCRALAWLAATEDSVRTVLRVGNHDEVVARSLRRQGSDPGVRKWALRAIAAIRGESNDGDARLWLSNVHQRCQDEYDESEVVPSERMHEQVCQPGIRCGELVNSASM